MEAAKAAISKITSRNGHRTEVDEVVVPAVTSEVIKPHRHEETTEAVDREVHQHHYHTTVQPITHKEIAAEKHTHNIVPQVEREFNHGDNTDVKQRVSTELGRFKDSSTVHETKHTKAAAAQVVGEHVHHHVHETVQPVIHKETIRPEVVHTTVPIHEIHHESAKHHGVSSLPMKTLDEFTNNGGVLHKKTLHTHEEYDGCPKPYNEKFQTTLDKVLPGHHNTHNTAVHPVSGTVGHSDGLNGLSGVNGVNGTHDSTKTHVSTHSDGARKDSGVGIHEAHYVKPTLKEKLNPRIDANGDGKAGIFS